MFLLLVTIGMKFWKTGKLVKAISESDFHRLQRSKGRGKDGGPSKLNRSPVTITDSDSDVYQAEFLLQRKKGRSTTSRIHLSCLTPTPALHPPLVVLRGK